MKASTIGIGLLGAGTVGGGLYDLLTCNHSNNGKQKCQFKIKKILVNDLSKKRASNIPKNLLTANFTDLVEDPEIHVIIEVIGGVHPALDYMQQALQSGKHVITANKEIISTKGPEIIALAKEKNLFFGFAAAVTGAHQLYPSIVSSMWINGITGIFNGTANYILSKLEDDINMQDALLQAQAKGYAEADPSADIDGDDTRSKLVIVSKLAFGVFLDREQIPMRGIRHISLKDMTFAKELGYTIRLIGRCQIDKNGHYSAGVYPSLIAKQHLLASVKGVTNGIVIEDKKRGQLGLTAQGAGSLPTAMAIYTDMILFSRGSGILWPDEKNQATPIYYSSEEKAISRFYVHWEVEDHPGVLATITRIFVQEKINIASIIQHESAEDESAHIIVLCGSTSNLTLKKALNQIAKNDFIRAKPLWMPVIEHSP